MGAKQTLPMPSPNSENDPGCVKTPCRCYDSPVVLGGSMRRFVEEADRGQWTLLPECLDDFIDESNPVRVIDVFVGALDLAEMSFEGVEPAATDRPSYHPSVLLKLYIYGYLNRVQSSRRLEREAGRNVEVMWLLGRLAPDHKTIPDFRKDNGLALRKVCTRFVELCREMGLLATANVAIDDSKFKAVNNRDRNFTKAKVQRRRAQLEESVARYLSQLDPSGRQFAVEFAQRLQHGETLPGTEFEAGQSGYAGAGEGRTRRGRSYAWIRHLVRSDLCERSHSRAA
ncbi:transposase [Bradyrhizobium sp. AZCC 1578]